jgi:hypothetical protein
MLRFDLEVPNLRAYELAGAAAARIGDADQLLLIIPGDNGSVPPTIEGVLRYLPPRRPDIDLAVASDLAAGLATGGYPRALLSCAPPGFALVPAGDGALLRRAGDGWQVEASWRYDPPPAHAHWSQVLAPAALCLAPLPTRG